MSERTSDLVVGILTFGENAGRQFPNVPGGFHPRIPAIVKPEHSIPVPQVAALLWRRRGLGPD